MNCIPTGNEKYVYSIARSSPSPNPSHRGRGYNVSPLPAEGEGWGEGDLQVKCRKLSTLKDFYEP